jgi:hypothetical protein
MKDTNGQSEPRALSRAEVEAAINRQVPKWLNRVAMAEEGDEMPAITAYQVLADQALMIAGWLERMES